MRRITKNGIEDLNHEEGQRIFDLVYSENSDDFHYLAFDRQLSGFSPLGSYILNYPALKEKENEIITALLERQEVESLYPIAKLSLYPVTQINDTKYYLDMENYKKHFADILELNDNVYKTKHLFVDFGHGAENFDEALVIQQLRELLSKSSILDVVYLEH